MNISTKKTDCQIIFDSLIEQGLIPKEKVKELDMLGNVIYNFLYFGSDWQAISDQLHDKLTLTEATERFKEIYNEYDILENDFYINQHCEYVFTNEPIFDEESFESDYKTELEECCCELSRKAFLRDYEDDFYNSFIKIECRKLFKEFLGPDTYDWIFI